MLAITRFYSSFASFEESLLGQRYKNCVCCDRQPKKSEIAFLTPHYTIRFNLNDLKSFSIYQKNDDELDGRVIHLRELHENYKFTFLGAILIHAWDE